MYILYWLYSNICNYQCVSTKRGEKGSRWLISMYFRSTKESKWIYVCQIVWYDKNNQSQPQYCFRRIYIYIYILKSSHFFSYTYVPYISVYDLCGLMVMIMMMIADVKHKWKADQMRKQQQRNRKKKKKNSSEGIQSLLFSSTLTSVIMSNEWNEMTNTCQVNICIYISNNDEL
jgi:hypothetical protein